VLDFGEKQWTSSNSFRNTEMHSYNGGDSMPKASLNNIQIEYETFGDSSSPPILLIIGLGGQLIYWDKAFCSQLADAGLYVIRFDNRDAGLSTKFDEAGVPDIMDVIGKLMSGQKVTTPYTTEEAAQAVPGSELKILEGMGHDLPHGEVWTQIAKDIIAHTQKQGVEGL